MIYWNLFIYIPIVLLLTDVLIIYLNYRFAPYLDQPRDLAEYEYIERCERIQEAMLHHIYRSYFHIAYVNC